MASVLDSACCHTSRPATAMLRFSALRLAERPEEECCAEHPVQEHRVYCPMKPPMLMASLLGFFLASGKSSNARQAHVTTRLYDGIQVRRPKVTGEQSSAGPGHGPWCAISGQ